ncbi:unnamed protein product [Peniophora sp. CBMAI 1063]|nr:unnamed protein product [Peniophora sp. CBMAI 1063]
MDTVGSDMAQPRLLARLGILLFIRQWDAQHQLSFEREIGISMPQGTLVDHSGIFHLDSWNMLRITLPGYSVSIDDNPVCVCLTIPFSAFHPYLHLEPSAVLPMSVQDCAVWPQNQFVISQIDTWSEEWDTFEPDHV